MWPACIFQSIYSTHTIHIHIYTYIYICTKIYIHIYIHMYSYIHTYRNTQPYHRTICVEHVAVNTEIWHSLFSLPALSTLHQQNQKKCHPCACLPLSVSSGSPCIRSTEKPFSAACRKQVLMRETKSNPVKSKLVQYNLCSVMEYCFCYLSYPFELKSVPYFSHFHEYRIES